MNFIRKEGNEKLEKLNNKIIFKTTKVEKVQDYSPKKNFNSKNIEDTKDSMEDLTQTTFDNSLNKDINKKQYNLILYLLVNIYTINKMM